MSCCPDQDSPKINLQAYITKFDELKTVFDNLPDGVIAILDKDMNIATANKAVADMLQLPIKNIVGKKITDLFEKKIPGLIEVLMETINTHKGVRNYILEFVTPSGEISSYLVSTAIVEEISDVDIGIVLILHDVSEITRLRKIALQIDSYGEIIGKSEPMKKVFALIESIKNYETSVLIVGDTGTGKELIARAIHNSSNRKNKPFVPVNCSALPENLIESELFGYVKGAFTGADSNRMGRFKAADGGTLFLDEAGTLPLKMQVKILRALQEKEIEPLGSSKSIPVNIRVISATNRDLSELVDQGEFREDLFYRLKVMQINLPSLCERKEDIPVLINYFITRLNRYYDKNIVGIAPGAEELLMAYKWPGNVRELENAIEHAFVLTINTLIDLKDLPPEIHHAGKNGVPAPLTENSPDNEEKKIKKALLVARGNRDKASKTLNMHRTTLWRKMKEFRIDKNFGKNEHH